jgi:DNA-binding Xre family transcriptional regulator
MAMFDVTQPLASFSSRDKLHQFLTDHHLHKKDFAMMIGVTQSHVYSLLDANESFSTRSSTLERIAVVMGISPFDLAEYRTPDDPCYPDPGVQYLQQQQQVQQLSNLQLLKRFPHPKRLHMVDMWRGAVPLPLDWSELHGIALVLGISKKHIYPFWEARLREHLSAGGLDGAANTALLCAMVQAVRQHLLTP